MLNIKNKRGKIIRVTIISLVVALIFSLLTYSIVSIVLDKGLAEAINDINLVSIDKIEEQKEDAEVIINKEAKLLQKTPEYGKKYGTLSIPSLNISKPLYNGEALSILKKGVGTATGSFFPSEGGTVVTMAHARSGFFKYLYTINIGDKVIIETSYGKFTYEVFETNVIQETDLDALRIQDEKEMLVLYTCYPSTSVGHTDQRFIAYANLVDEVLL